MAAALAFTGGYALRKKFENFQLPQVHRAKKDELTFKLSVRVISAAVPALKEPGAWSRQRPRVEIVLGETQKDTELADYSADDNTCAMNNSRECPWRFGETLTFVCRTAEVLSSGLHIRLRAHSDFQLGPVQFQFASVSELGEASVDIRRRALPSCIGNRHGKDGKWESPALVVPLSHVKGGKCSADYGIGEAVAHVTLGFSVDTDPEAILAAVEAETQTVAEALGVNEVMHWMEKPWDAAWLAPMGHGLDNEGCNTDGCDYSRGNNGWKDCNDDPFGTIMGDLDKDGWIAHTAPNGRKFWHHRDLGPAPWEVTAADSTPPPLPTKGCQNINVAEQIAGALSVRSAVEAPHGRSAVTPLSTRQAPAFENIREQIAQLQAGNETTPSRQGGQKSKIVNSPDQDPDAWVSHEGPDGRIFWHHLALGPPPWLREGTKPAGHQHGLAPHHSNVQSRAKYMR